MQITAQMTCFAPDNKLQTVNVTDDVATPGHDIQDWADNHLSDIGPELFNDQNGLRALVVGCAERPDLVGRQFEWWY